MLVNIFFISAYLITRNTAEFEQTGSAYGVTVATFVLACLTLFYLVTIYWIIAKRSLAFATFLGSMIHTLPMLSVLDATNLGPSATPYVALWIAVSFINGMYGPMVLFGSFLVASLYILLEISFMPKYLSGVGIVFLIGELVIVGIGYLFWRNKFLGDTEQVNRLSEMINSKETQAEILLQSIADGVIVTDTGGVVTMINKSAAKIAAWPEKEAINFDARPILRLIGDEKTGELISDEDHPISQVLRMRKPFSKTLRMIDRNNKKIYVSLVVSPVVVPDNDSLVGAVAVLRDVSAEKGEEQRRAEFISTASHEMRTPVAAIEGYLALALNDKVSTIDSKARDYLDKAHKSTQHLGKLFQDLLTSAKAEDGRLTSHPQVVEMGSFIQQLSEDLKFSAEKKGLKVEFMANVNEKTASGAIDATGGSRTLQPLYYTYVDPDRIREVVTNVFDNAVKYTEQGKVSIGLTANNEVVQIKISDTGPGIPPEDLPHLFQKFYRVDNSATRTIGGTGLGLFICRKIVEMYNGAIWAESEVGKGSTFYINLPRLDSARATQMQNSQNTATKSP